MRGTRVVFILYLTGVVAGLVFAVVLGLLGR
jgi:hypothetical protein